MYSLISKLFRKKSLNSLYRDLEIIPSSWDGWNGNPPVYPLYEHYLRYVFALKNILDLATLLPYYFQSMGEGAAGGAVFLRVFRLLKIVRILKGAYYVSVYVPSLGHFISFHGEFMLFS